MKKLFQFCQKSFDVFVSEVFGSCQCPKAGHPKRSRIDYLPMSWFSRRKLEGKK